MDNVITLPVTTRKRVAIGRIHKGRTEILKVLESHQSHATAHRIAGAINASLAEFGLTVGSAVVLPGPRAGHHVVLRLSGHSPRRSR